MMSFAIPFAPCDANTGTSGIICTKSQVSPHFDHCDLINALVPMTTGLVPKGCLDLV